MSPDRGDSIAIRLKYPWSRGDKTDPWDHVESAMGLTVGGFYAQARQAYLWVAVHATDRRQLVCRVSNGKPFRSHP